MQDTRIDNSTAADRLIAAHDGDVALLYIYRQHTGCPDLERAARDLCRTMQELRAAQEKLVRLGLWAEDDASAPSGNGGKAPRYLPPADELPQYTAQDISRLAAASRAKPGDPPKDSLPLLPQMPLPQRKLPGA